MIVFGQFSRSGVWSIGYGGKALPFSLSFFLLAIREPLHSQNFKMPIVKLNCLTQIVRKLLGARARLHVPIRHALTLRTSSCSAPVQTDVFQEKFKNDPTTPTSDPAHRISSLIRWISTGRIHKLNPVAPMVLVRTIQVGHGLTPPC